MNHAITRLYEDVVYRLKFVENSQESATPCRLHLMTGEDVTGLRSPLQIHTYPSGERCLLTTLMLSKPAGALLPICLPRLDSVYYQKMYEEGFAIGLNRYGKPVLKCSGGGMLLTVREYGKKPE